MQRALRPWQRPETVSDADDRFDVLAGVGPEFSSQATDALVHPLH